MPVSKNWQETAYYIGAAIIFLIYSSLCVRVETSNKLADSLIAISFFPTAFFFLQTWRIFFIRFLAPALF